MTLERLKIPAIGILISTISVIIVTLGFVWTQGIAPAQAQCREVRATLEADYVRKADLKDKLDAIERAVAEQRRDIRALDEKSEQRHLELLRAIYKRKN